MYSVFGVYIEDGEANEFCDSWAMAFSWRHEQSGTLMVLG